MVRLKQNERGLLSEVWVLLESEEREEQFVVSMNVLCLPHEQKLHL